MEQRYSYPDERIVVRKSTLAEGLLIACWNDGHGILFEVSTFHDNRVFIEKGSAKYLSDFSSNNLVASVPIGRCVWPTFNEYTKYYSMKGI